ncbi:SgcJ/EcaC family oxidoreductase [Streptomyces natalensis]|uniref:SgcJ/EcaC family oxidoreductase n=1 Tax=Streptomyces natalensis TaxID=68242 RepID=UPI0005C8155F|nr:SgcJ/EcaC family oxidoreductase [Streptomyces natalensis]
MNATEVRTVFDAMETAWARSDADSFGRIFSHDADFTSVRADHYHGSDQIAAAHQHLFGTVYAGTQLEVTVQRVTRLGPDLALARVENRVRIPHPGTDLVLHAQAVLERRRENFLIIAFMNMAPLSR